MSGTRRRSSAITPSDRASFCGASTTAMKSSNSTATLWCVPPDTRHTPDAIWVERTTTGGTSACATASGTSSGSGSTFARSSPTVISIELWPGWTLGSPWCECSTVGNITPSKSW